jgi:hypothetical protein
MNPFHPRSFLLGGKIKDRRIITNRKKRGTDPRAGTDLLSAIRRDPVPRSPILGWRLKEPDGPGVLRPNLRTLPPEGTSIGKESPTRLGSDSLNLPRETDGTHMIPNGTVRRTRTYSSARRNMGFLPHRFRVPLEPAVKGKPFKVPVDFQIAGLR